jgi:hypothetical protein
MPASGRHHAGEALSLRGWAAEAEAAAGIAKALAPTAFVPEHLRVYTNPLERDPSKRVLDYESTVAQIAAVLLAGQELQFQPMASLRAFVIIRGSVALYAIAARALLQWHGHDIIVRESTSTRAIVAGRRAGDDQWQTSTWDIDRAKIAGLYPGHPEGNWRKQTKAMLVARATAEAARWIASDAMLGLPLIAEELEDADREILPDAAAILGDGQGDGQAATGSKRGTARRKSGEQRAELPALPAPPPPGVPAPRAGTPVADPAPPGPKATKAQLGKLHAGLTEIGVTGRTEGLALISAWAGRQVAQTSDLARSEIDVVFERLDALRAIRAHEEAPDGQPPDGADEGHAAEPAEEVPPDAESQ